MAKSIKKNSASSSKSLSTKIVDTLIRYVKIQLLLTVVVAAVFWALLSLLHIPYAGLLALMTGVTSAIPIIGGIISAVVVALIAVFDGVRFLPNLPEIFEGLSILVLYMLLNGLVDYFISPYLTGKVTHVHPLLVLAAVIMGSLVFGILGALLAVPAVLVIKTILEHNKKPR